ncbi:hypothetical protein RHGRI_007176 [Rhododendron griersonianum]|uniref:Uncharacterized protein n=1 Tax=Rhododendron griersonianum TaxID=479676 RepID=A0AAV6KWP8_9ERIC|nr:hypothetical protein RHGRI_007176 [Rhododendron griersonianum]
MLSSPCVFLSVGQNSVIISFVGTKRILMVKHFDLQSQAYPDRNLLSRQQQTIQERPKSQDSKMGKVYGVFGWEYRKPVRAPPACPYKPAANKSSSEVAEKPDLAASDGPQKLVGAADESKID